MTLRILALCALLTLSGKAFAIDIGPVHIHGTKVKVGSTIELKIVVEKIKMHDEEKDRVKTLRGRRKNSDDKYDIKVPWGDLDERSREILKKVKEDESYEMKLERMDDDWRLLKIRRND
jgi:hypothetical protein